MSAIRTEIKQLNDSCIKIGPHLLNMEELLKPIATEIKRLRNELLRISNIELYCAYSQLKLSEETSRQCIFALTGRNPNGYYRFF